MLGLSRRLPRSVTHTLKEIIMKAVARNVLVALTTTAALAAANAQAGSMPAAHSNGPGKGASSAASVAKLTAAERAKVEALTHEATTLMAHAGIAAIALDADMRDTARAHIEDALKIADRLTAETAQVNASMPLLTAKVTEKTGLGDRNYWLPLENDRFTFRDIDAVMARRHTPAVDEVAVQSVRMRMYLDTASVRRDLQRAKRAIEEGNYGYARDALRLAQLSTFSETVAVDQPLQRIRDNLLLARELSAQKNYASARGTLQYAQRELKAIETDQTKAGPDVVKLQNEINTLEKGLEAKDPSAFSRAATDIERWLAQVEGWLKSHGA